MELTRLRVMLSVAVGYPDEWWCARSTRLRGRAVGRRVCCLDVLLPDPSE